MFDTTFVFVVVLFAGALHAVWNAIAKAATDRQAGNALIGIGTTIAGGLMVLAAPLPARSAWPWLMTSVVLHLGYFWLLSLSYSLGDFSRIYPLARGTGPLIVVIVAAVALHERLGVGQFIGIAAVCGGLCALALDGGRVWRKDRHAIAAALLTGVMIAAYTVTDGIGVRASGTAYGYGGWLFLSYGPLITMAAFVARGRAVLPGMAKQWRSGIAGGVISCIAYGLVVWAQTKAPLAIVAALRETGVITAAIIGIAFFRERMGPRRVAAAAVVVLGVALMNVR